eukprot:GHRQ01019390.1.p1 GENE.GHRQ01019390.1~~GHRQ01019390.1.p1  ORF type:complete len:113 (+),score=24.45 GHRQ01019390.1:831-1169(+)
MLQVGSMMPAQNHFFLTLAGLYNMACMPADYCLTSKYEQEKQQHGCHADQQWHRLQKAHHNRAQRREPAAPTAPAAHQIHRSGAVDGACMVRAAASSSNQDCYRHSSLMPTV